MKHVLKIVLDTIQESKNTLEIERQLNKIVEMEDKFLTDFTKEKWTEYFNLDIEKLKLSYLQMEQAIKIAIRITRNIYQH